jgi:hypothetical protein
VVGSGEIRAGAAGGPGPTAVVGIAANWVSLVPPRGRATVQGMVSTTADRPQSARREDATVPSGAAWATIVVLAVVAATRSPHLLTTGRFWAEEGTTWFGRMVVDSGPQQLVFVNPRTGYVLSIANIGAWIAAKVPIEQAPLVPTWISFALVLTIVWVVLRWPSEVLTTRWARVLAAALVVVGTLAVAEVWLNTTNAQTYLGVLALLLLFVPVDELDRRHFAVAIALLALALTSGLWAVGLAPLFVAVAVHQRSRRRWIVAAVAGSLAALQVALMVYAKLADNLAPSRSEGGGVVELIGGPAKYHLMGFVGGTRSLRVLHEATTGELAPNIVAGIVGVVVLAILALGLWRSNHRRVPLLLVASLVIVEVLVQLGSIGGGVGGRYSVVPIAILTLMAIYGATMATDRGVRIAATVLLGSSLVTGLAGFWTEAPAMLRCIDCPDWSREAEQWQAGEADELEIWPYDGERPWVIRPARDR